jgi:hypothetical protein
VVFQEFDELIRKAQIESGGAQKTQIQMEHSAKGEIIKNNGNPVVAGRSSDTTSLKTTILASDLKALRDKCNNMFLMAITPGFHDNSWKLSDQTLKLQRSILGPEHPDTLGVMHTVAVQYYNDKEFSEAIQKLESVQKLREKVLGPMHIDTLSSLEVRMKVYEDWAKLEDITPGKALSKLLMARNIGVELLNLRLRALGNQDVGPDVVALEEYVLSLTAQCKIACQSAPDKLNHLKHEVKMVKETCG